MNLIIFRACSNKTYLWNWLWDLSLILTNFFSCRTHFKNNGILRLSISLERWCTSTQIRAVSTKFGKNVANAVYGHWSLISQVSMLLQMQCKFNSMVTKAVLYKVWKQVVNYRLLLEPRQTGLQLIFQNLSDIMSGRNEILSDIYEKLSDINFYKNFIKS